MKYFLGFKKPPGLSDLLRNKLWSILNKTFQTICHLLTFLNKKSPALVLWSVYHGYLPTNRNGHM